MQFKTNSAYIIGDGHKYCEDFAYHAILKDKVDQEIALAIVADGCSSSLQKDGIRNPINVDFGSRLATIVSASVLKKILRGVEITEDFRFSSIYESQFIHYFNLELWRAIRSIGVNLSVLDTTLLICLVFPNGQYNFIAWGDGFMVIKDYSCYEFLYRKVLYLSNAPLYVSYSLDPQKRERYIKEFGSERIDEEGLVYYDENIDPEITIESNDGFSPLFVERFILLEDKEIIIMSDGASSFEDIDGNPISSRCFLKWMTQNKTSGSSFIERRINLLNRWKKKNNIRNIDDFSMAGIMVSQ